MAAEEMNLLLEERREAIKLLRQILYRTTDPDMEIPEDLKGPIKRGWEFIRVIDGRWKEALQDLQEDERGK